MHFLKPLVLKLGQGNSQQSPAWGYEAALWLWWGAAIQQYNWELNHEVL